MFYPCHSAVRGMSWQIEMSLAATNLHQGMMRRPASGTFYHTPACPLPHIDHLASRIMIVWYSITATSAEVSATPGIRAIAPIPIALFATFVPGVMETTGLSSAGCGQQGTALQSTESSHLFMLE